MEKKFFELSKEKKREGGFVIEGFSGKDEGERDFKKLEKRKFSGDIH